jgi:hypothetical protein
MFFVRSFSAPLSRCLPACRPEYGSKRLIVNLLLLSAWMFNTVLAQTINYQEVFGDDWNKAMAFERTNRIWMEPVLVKNHISYPIAIAVIFPELVRYSALRDKMEITLLKTLYVNLGEEYANFSIGQFQMKPSFAELIRLRAPEVMNRRSGIVFKSESDFDDIRNFRKSIVSDLEDIRTEFNYLVAFMKICEKSYKTDSNDNLSRLKFIATAYNYGIDKTSSQIENMMDKKFFNTKLFKTENYSYADVSLFWYKQYKSIPSEKP